jgi:hypothetical protein
VPDATEDNRSQIAIATEAVQRAEDGLQGLPQSADVRRLQRRVLALKTVLLGVVRDVPTLSEEQREILARDAMALVIEVLDCRNPATG